MNQITSKSGKNRLILFSFILLYSVFTSEYAFSQKQWSRDDMDVTYKRDKTVDIHFLFYDYGSGPIDEIPHIKDCKFTYSENNKNFKYFIFSAKTRKQVDDPQRCMTMVSKKTGQTVQFLDCYEPKNGDFWPNHSRNIAVKVPVSEGASWKGDVFSRFKGYKIRLKWTLPNSKIKYIKISGNWGNSRFNQFFEEVYPIDDFKCNSYTMKNAPSVLKSKINNEVKVIKDSDAITVTGVEPGENIKVYTVLGAEVKSVVANKDAVNIKLAKNQHYIVNTGQACYKVALCVP